MKFGGLFLVIPKALDFLEVSFAAWEGTGRCMDTDLLCPAVCLWL